MRIDCYNASECTVGKMLPGDTFYFDGVLHIKVALNDVDIIPHPTKFERCYIVALDTGNLKSVKADAPVIFADTKVVANNAV